MTILFLRRLGAIFYDSFLLVALLMLATALLLLLNGAKPIPPHTFLYQVYLLVVAYLYFDYCWRHGGQTLGMKAWKIRCVGAISHRQTLLRFLGAILSFVTLGLGFALRWPEKISGTMLEKTSY
jgi:uncharacterized RDD family membrane protein YckC